MRNNSDGDDVLVGYDLSDLTDVKADGEEGMSRVMGTIREGVLADAWAS